MVRGLLSGWVSSQHIIQPALSTGAFHVSRVSLFPIPIGANSVGLRDGAIDYFEALSGLMVNMHTDGQRRRLEVRTLPARRPSFDPFRNHLREQPVIPHAASLTLFRCSSSQARVSSLPGLLPATFSLEKHQSERLVMTEFLVRKNFSTAPITTLAFSMAELALYSLPTGGGA